MKTAIRIVALPWVAVSVFFAWPFMLAESMLDRCPAEEHQWIEAAGAVLQCAWVLVIVFGLLAIERGAL